MPLIRHRDPDATCLSVLAISRALGMPDGSSLATACRHPSHASSIHAHLRMHLHPMLGHPCALMTSICRPKTCLLSRSSPSSHELQLVPRTPSSRISSPTWLHHRKPSAKTTSVQSLRHVSKTVLYTLRPAGSPCVRPRSHARTMAPSLTVRHKRCHVLTVVQHAVLRTITLLVRLSCRHCVSLGILALHYLSESCILAFVSTSQICCGDVFAAESEGEVSPHMLLCHGC